MMIVEVCFSKKSHLEMYVHVHGDVHNYIYYVSTSERPSELPYANFISLHVKITCSLKFISTRRHAISSIP